MSLLVNSDAVVSVFSSRGGMRPHHAAGKMEGVAYGCGGEEFGGPGDLERISAKMDFGSR
ncbi:hypothetical protein T4B_1868 [Trichinella pseudospiralis]|uniref:Uncharacterized protein n=1 Tax=Trichinella pseudospiralis TaxID=6337 RepID=A0A0V1IDX9_TRIPS|nr:hypothetical protein T4A_1324 [Trichinella pseudospiralis]KRZ21023.1 hypothetical protein T4B_1868 [Trichinella pseudospiralis]